MRTTHTPHTVHFPVYGCSFVDEDKVLLCGGGGPSKTGVPNTITLYQTKSTHALEQLASYELGADEDAPMSMAFNADSDEFICGVNASLDSFKKGENKNCRVFELNSNNKLSLRKAVKVFPGAMAEDYIRVISISRDSKLVGLGSTANELQILSYPTLDPLAEPIPSKCGEVYDIDFGGNKMAVAGTSGLSIYSLGGVEQSANGGDPGNSRRSSRLKSKGKSSGSKEKPPSISFNTAVETPSLPGTSTDDSISYRAARFDPQNPEVLFSVINLTPSRKAKGKGGERRCFVIRYDTKTWTPDKIKQLGEKGRVTCFDISADGRFLAYGTQTCAVGVLDAESLAPVFTILKAHEFPPTTLRFSPDGGLLVSASADKSVRLIKVPNSKNGSSWITIMLILLAVLVILLGIGAQSFMRT